MLRSYMQAILKKARFWSMFFLVFSNCPGCLQLKNSMDTQSHHYCWHTLCWHKNTETIIVHIIGCWRCYIKVLYIIHELSDERTVKLFDINIFLYEQDTFILSVSQKEWPWCRQCVLLQRTDYHIPIITYSMADKNESW